MFNIGLEVLRPAQGEIPEDWSYEQFYEISNDLNKGFDAINNLISIRESIQKYGKTPQLMELVGSSFESSNITFSNEGIVEAIKDFFVWIKDKIVELWKWFWGLFGFCKNETKNVQKASGTAISVAEAVKSGNKERIQKEKEELLKEIQKAHPQNKSTISEGNGTVSFVIHNLDSLREYVGNNGHFSKFAMAVDKLLKNYRSNIVSNPGAIQQDTNDINTKYKEIERLFAAHKKQKRTYDNIGPDELINLINESNKIHKELESYMSVAKDGLSKLDAEIKEAEAKLASVDDPNQQAFLKNAMQMLKGFQTMVNNLLVTIQDLSKFANRCLVKMSEAALRF